MPYLHSEEQLRQEEARRRESRKISEQVYSHNREYFAQRDGPKKDGPDYIDGQYMPEWLQEHWKLTKIYPHMSDKDYQRWEKRHAHQSFATIMRNARHDEDGRYIGQSDDKAISSSGQISPADLAYISYLFVPLLVGFFLGQGLGFGYYKALIAIWTLPFCLVGLLSYAHHKRWKGFQQEHIAWNRILLILGVAILATVGWLVSNAFV